MEVTKQTRVTAWRRVLSALLALVMVVGVVACAVPLFALPVLAETEGGFTYTVSGGEATITDYTGSATELVIPSTLGGYPVVDIGFRAFYGCTSLTSITIPNSVTSIGELAFGTCTSLTSETIPNSVTSIGDGAFSSCTSLTSVTIPDSVTSIGHGAFSRCTSLTSVTIPNSVTSIDYFTFEYCESLTSVTIPDSVTNIDDYAFSNCYSLTSITIPDSVTSIGHGAFSRCTSLTSIDVNSSNKNYVSIDGALFNKSATELIVCPGGKQGAYTIPDGVTEICDDAFFYCEKLTGITIPDSVTSIGDGAFSECASLTAYVYENSYAHNYCINEGIRYVITKAPTFQNNTWIFVVGGVGVVVCLVAAGFIIMRLRKRRV